MALFLILAPKVGPSPLSSRQMTLPMQAFSIHCAQLHDMGR